MGPLHVERIEQAHRVAGHIHAVGATRACTSSSGPWVSWLPVPPISKMASWRGLPRLS